MIIGLSGKKQSGKDTVGKLINYLFTGGEKTYVPPIGEFLKYYNDGIDMYPWETKQFAYKLKQIVCILIGCTMEQLEDNEFKEKELGEEWRIHKVLYDEGFGSVLVGIFNTQEEATKKCHEYVLAYQDTFILTPRKLLQLLGTDCGRKIIHPNIWVNSLMNEYKEQGLHYNTSIFGGKSEFPNWIITDVRFPEEVKAIEDRGGIILRIDRPGLESLDTHESETALDDYPFKHRIINDGSIEDLILKVKQILEDLKII